MAISDVYTFKSGSVAVASTSATAVLSVISTAALRGWLVGIELNIGVTAAAAGNSILFQLCRPGNTVNGSSGFGGNPEDFSAPASVLQGYTTWTTAPTVGTVLWEKELPQTTGTAWSYYPPTGYEFQVPAIANNAANAGLHMIVTASVATSTPVLVDLICSE
ncbi:MAG TPA: hypothetical protein VKU39_11215 [Streptosporangiaceae bacterium]|nr:hypothetical protein [Streptosporangiaceae bacterium]